MRRHPRDLGGSVGTDDGQVVQEEPEVVVWLFGVWWYTLDAFDDAVADSFAIAPELKGGDALLKDVEGGAKLSSVARDDVALEGGPDVSGVVVGVVDPPIPRAQTRTTWGKRRCHR